MEGTFSVSTNNRFAFFMDDEDDPGDMVLRPDGKIPEKSPKTVTTDVSPSPKKIDKLTKGKVDQKPLSQPIKKPQGDVAGGKRRDNQFNERDQQQNYKANENRPPRENKRPFTGSNNSTRGGGDGNRGGDGRPFRQNRGGRGRLPSREKQDGDNEKTGGNAGGPGTDDVVQRDARSRPRWNDRNNSEFKGRTEREDGGERNGGFRSSRPPRGGFRGGKREYERRSGNDKTSVKPFDKKEGAGSHNWGTAKDDINATTSGASDEWPNDDGEQTEVTPGQKEDLKDENENTETDKAPVEPQPDETTQEKEEELFTLEEYKAKQEKTRLVPVFKERKPGENEDTTRWKDTFVYERVESELVPGTREIVEKYKSSGRVKTAVESNFFFKDTSRFGRGGGPGKRGPERRQFEDKDRQGRQFEDRQQGGRQFEDRQQGRQFENKQGRQFENKQGQEERERRPRRSDGERGDRERGDRERGDRDRERGDRDRGDRDRGDRDRGDRERRPRRYDDDSRNERRGGGGGGNRTRDRSKFNVEDEKDFPSLGTVSA